MTDGWSYTRTETARFIELEDAWLRVDTIIAITPVPGYEEPHRSRVRTSDGQTYLSTKTPREVLEAMLPEK